MYNITHKLLLIGKDVMRLPFTKLNVQCHSLSFGDRKRCDEPEHVFGKMCNVAHSLLVMGKDVMRLLLTKMSNIAHKLLVIGNDVIRLCFRKNVQCH
jgi:hypothetical protein